MKRIHFATPALGIVPNWAASMLATVDLLRTRYEVEVELLAGVSHVGQARNRLANGTVRGGYDCQLSIDADQSWFAEDALAVVTAVLEHGADGCGAPVPYKRLVAARVRALALAGAPDEVLLSSPETTTGWFGSDMSPDGTYVGPLYVLDDRPFGRAQSIASFTCWSADVLRRMSASVPELHYDLPEEGSALFESAVVRDTTGLRRSWIGEDRAACLRALRVGARFLVLLDADVTHHGAFAYRSFVVPGGQPTEWIREPAR